MAKRTAGPQTLSISQWTGINGDDETGIRLTDLKNLRNFKLTDERYLIRRLGCTKVYEGLSGAIQAFMEYDAPDNTRHLIAIADSKPYRWDGLSWILVADTTLDIDPDRPVRYENLNNYLYFGNRTIYRIQNSIELGLVTSVNHAARTATFYSIESGLKMTYDFDDLGLVYHEGLGEIRIESDMDLGLLMEVCRTGSEIHVSFIMSKQVKATVRLQHAATSMEVTSSKDHLYVILRSGTVHTCYKFDKSTYLYTSASTDIGHTLKCFTVLEDRLYYYYEHYSWVQPPGYWESYAVIMKCDLDFANHALVGKSPGTPVQSATHPDEVKVVPFIAYNQTSRQYCWLEFYRIGTERYLTLFSGYFPAPNNQAVYHKRLYHSTESEVNMPFIVHPLVDLDTYSDSSLENVNNFYSALARSCFFCTSADGSLERHPLYSASPASGEDLCDEAPSANTLIRLNSGTLCVKSVNEICGSYREAGQDEVESVYANKESTGEWTKICEREDYTVTAGVVIGRAEFAGYENPGRLAINTGRSNPDEYLELNFPPSSLDLTHSNLVCLSGYNTSTEVIEGPAGSTLNGHIFTSHQSRIVFADTTDKYNLVYTDAFTDEISAGNYEPFDTAIKGLAASQGRLYVFLANRIYAVDGIFGNHSIGRISEKVGTPAPDSVQEFEDKVFFLSMHGPYVLSGNIPIDLSRPIIRKFFDKSSAECINYNCIHLSRGIVDPVNREYRVWVPSHGSSVPDLCLVYNWELKYWRTENMVDGTYPLALSRFQDGDGLDQVYLCSDGRILQLNTGWHDDYKRIEWEVESGKIGGGQYRQIVKRMVLAARVHPTLMVEYRADDNDYQSAMISQGPETGIKNHPVRVMNGRGLCFQYRIRGSGLDEPAVIRRIDLEAYPTSSRGNAYD